jgi:hypothetical protein
MSTSEACSVYMGTFKLLDSRFMHCIFWIEEELSLHIVNLAVAVRVCQATNRPMQTLASLQPGCVLYQLAGCCQLLPTVGPQLPLSSRKVAAARS